MKHFTFVLSVGVAALFVAGLPTRTQAATPASASGSDIPNTVPTATPRTCPFRVIGYATESITPQTIPYKKLTHINYAFLIPNAEGTFAPLNNLKVKALVKQGHKNGVKVPAIPGEGKSP